MCKALVNRLWLVLCLSPVFGCYSNRVTSGIDHEPATVRSADDQSEADAKIVLRRLNQLTKECLGRNYLEIRNRADKSNEKKVEAILDRCHGSIYRECTQIVSIVSLRIEDQIERSEFLATKVADCPNAMHAGLKKGINELLNSRE